MAIHDRRHGEIASGRHLGVIDRDIDELRSTYLHSLISVQPPRATGSSSVVTLSRPRDHLHLLL